MQFIIIPTDQLKEVDPEWEYRRKSNDGTKAIIHKEIYDELVPQTMNLTYNEQGNPIETEPTYPFPIVSGDEINNMIEFTNPEHNDGDQTINR